MDSQKKEETTKWILLYAAAEFILLVLAVPFITRLLKLDIKTPIHDALRGYEPVSAAAFILWIILSFVFVVFIIKASIKVPSNKKNWTYFMEKIFEALKITFAKKSNILGTTYDAAYYDLKIKCKIHMGSEDSPNFVDIKINHARHSNLGIVIRNKGAAALVSGEGKDLFAKSIKPLDPYFENIDIFAKNKEAVENMFYNIKITEPLRKLTGIIDSMGIKPNALDKFLGGLSGFYMNDNYISVRIEESLVKEENIENIKNMIVNAAELSRAFSMNLPTT